LDIITTNLLAKSPITIQEAFSAFLKRPRDYRNGFMQSRYDTAFDGYSYMGQKDSLNQYDSDMLHSFVLSDFQPVEDFPEEFQGFLTDEWPQLTAKVREMELKIIDKLDLPFKQLYEDDTIGYMMSCNYYPKPSDCNVVAKNTRLSMHADVSLLTTFPYGVAKGLSYFQHGKHIQVNENEKTIVFFGYFADFISDGEVKAIEHQVELPVDLDSERYSFAIFSIPKPGSIFQLGNRKFSGNDYYAKYLSLF
jgi:hypothetical protein